MREIIAESMKEGGFYLWKLIRTCAFPASLLRNQVLAAHLASQPASWLAQLLSHRYPFLPAPAFLHS
jgi:hypothetical protein